MPAQYSFCSNVNGTFTIIENNGNGAYDYQLELETYEEGVRLVNYLRWLEETYSPPRT
jgi:hypothetical protein